MNKFIPTAKQISSKEIYSKKWLRLKVADYMNNGKLIKDYEYVERTSKKGEFDGIDILGIMNYPISKQNKKLLLISNYRPPIDKFILQFPAGLVESTDLMSEAERELKEETGYVPERVLSILSQSTIPQLSPILYGDPWKSNESGKLIILEINGDDKKNIDAKQELEESENIKPVLFDLKKTLIQDIINYSKENNHEIEAKVYTFCLGINFASIIHI